MTKEPQENSPPIDGLDESQAPPIKRIERTLRDLAQGRGDEGFVAMLLIINFILLFVRPQDFPGLKIIGTLRLPMVFTILSALALLGRYRTSITYQLKIVYIFLGFEALRGVVGYALDPANTIVRNDFWHFQTWKDLLLQMLALVIPLLVATCNMKRLRQVFYTAALTAGILGIWSVTHQGKGPGGFLGDENDNCLVLLTMLPFAFCVLVSEGSALKRILALGSAVLALGGAVATSSRGGFLGLAAIAGYFFLVSQKKVLWVFGALIFAVAALPFVPQEYYGEISSIGTEVRGKTGTIQERFDTWKIVLTMWSDPRNTVFGVGLNNTPWNTRDYEPVERGRTQKSLAGRAVHSFYVGTLGDLGLWGVCIIGTLLVSCIGNLRRSNRRMRKIKDNTSRALVFLQKYLQKLEDNTSRLALQDDAESTQGKEHLLLVKGAQRQVDFFLKCTPLILCSWLGMLVAAIGISVLYYPPFWFLVGLSSCLIRYGARLEATTLELLQRVEKISRGEIYRS